MKKLIICAVALFILISCNSGNKQSENVYSGLADYTMSQPQTYEYQGFITEPEGTDTHYDLTISKNEYSSEGKFILITTSQMADRRKKQSNTSRGYLQERRGNTDDPNAIIYKLTDEVDDTVIYLQVMRKNRLRLLTNYSLQDSINGTALNCDLVLVQ